MNLNLKKSHFCKVSVITVYLYRGSILKQVSVILVINKFNTEVQFISRVKMIYLVRTLIVAVVIAIRLQVPIEPKKS